MLKLLKGLQEQNLTFIYKEYETSGYHMEGNVGGRKYGNLSAKPPVLK